MNIIIVTTGSRPELLEQTLVSLHDNAADFGSHHLTVVGDGRTPGFIQLAPDTFIHNVIGQGASASRNIGAGSIPKYRRQEHVLFLDDDVYLCDKWDERLNSLAKWATNAIISGYSHPFNHCEPKVGHNIVERDSEGSVKIMEEVRYGEPLVISSVAMMMPWRIFDDVGPWPGDGGPGGSEDYAICMTAKDRGYGFAVTAPQCCIHTGLTSSNGKPIVGADVLRKQNEELETLYGIEGRIIYG